MHKTLARAVVVTLLALMTALIVAVPAEAAPSPWRAVLTFQKNWRNQFDSRLTWQLYQRQAGGAWKVVQVKSWRAGSGLPGRAGRDSCAISQGWLPNGTYRLRQYNNYPGSVIKGRVFRLDNKACPSGRVRHQLFLHSEQTVHNTQCRDRRGDQPCRWEFPRINDYKSLGCIKMSPWDIAELTALFHRHFSAGVRYAAARVSLRVTG